MQDIQVFPDVDNRKAHVRISVKNITGKAAEGKFVVSAESFNTAEKHVVEPYAFETDIADGCSTVEFDFDLGEDVLLWDEYNPNMYKLTVSLETRIDNKSYYDCRTQEFGMRKFLAVGTQFSINDRIVFLRGTHDGCVFPLTGYSPMNVEDWIRVFQIAKSYGLNHYRFHSWCPPEAAFKAADLVGIYLQPELPNWASFYEPDDENYCPEHEEYLRKEGHRIMKSFGNHPSFVMFALGNELFGSKRIMADILKELRAYDNRHLYAQGSNNFYSAPSLAEGDDFWVTMRTKGLDYPVRGSFSYADLPLGHIQSNEPPSTMFDYSESIKGVPVPVIGHEIGQYQSFPNFNEISKYTGVLRARNLEVFRQRLYEKGMLEQADDFLQASGKLATICYREEIETALRTYGFAGFQLLDIKDFPGQGTALVGILDAFMDSKGFIEPEEWREFCSDVVLFARIPKYTYFAGEKFKARVEISHYGNKDIDRAIVEWKLLNCIHESVAYGELPPVSIKQGGVTTLGLIEVSTDSFDAPEKLVLQLKIKGFEIVNHYPIWIYPSTLDDGNLADIKICYDFNDEARKLLEEEHKVLLFPDSNKLSNCVGGSFASDFWCYPMFRDICKNMGLKPSPGTLGILCDPKHPLFREFPTEFHSNWQWWPIAMNSYPIILDNMPSDFRPIVQVIDNFERNHKLGLLFEVRVGKGSLLVCASDLIKYMDRPEVRQFQHSLLKYMGSEEFNPKTIMDMSRLEQLLG